MELPDLTDESYAKTEDNATCLAGGTVTYTFEAGEETISFDVQTPALPHDISAVAGKNATCTEDGYGAHYKCNVCNTLFADEDGETVIAEPPAIPSPGHNIQPVARKDSTCTEEGYEAHYKCETCNTLFADADGETVIAEPTAITKKAHDIQPVPQMDPTCVTEGYEAHFKCETCNTLFADEDGETVIDEPASIPTVAHTIVPVSGVAPTCREAGYDDCYQCSVCLQYYSDVLGEEEIDGRPVLEALEHKNAYWVIVAEPTAHAAGEAYLTCDDCGLDLQTIALPAFDEDNYTKVETKSSDCATEYTYTTVEALTGEKSLQFTSVEPKDKPEGHQWVADGEQPDANKLHVTCHICNATATFDYDGTIGAGGATKDSPVLFETPGSYLFKPTAASSTLMFYALPILSAGIYMVEIINADTGTDDTRRPISYSTTAIAMAIDSAGTVHAGARYQSGFKTTGSDAGIMTGEVVIPSYNSNVKEFRWVNVVADNSLVGGKLIFTFGANGEVDTHPVIFKVTMPDMNLTEGENKIKITDNETFTAEYYFKVKTENWYEISITAETKAAAKGNFVVLLDATEETIADGSATPVFDAADGLTSKVKITANVNHTLTFQTAAAGNYKVTLTVTTAPDVIIHPQEKPSKVTEITFTHPLSTVPGRGTTDFVVASDVEEGEYWFYIQYIKSIRANNVNIQVNGGPTISLNLTGSSNFGAAFEGWAKIITVKGGDVITFTNPGGTNIGPEMLGVSLIYVT